MIHLHVNKNTFGVENFFQLQQHVSEPAHVTDQLHDVVWVRGGNV